MIVLVDAREIEKTTPGSEFIPSSYIFVSPTQEKKYVSFYFISISDNNHGIILELEVTRKKTRLLIF